MDPNFDTAFAAEQGILASLIQSKFMDFDWQELLKPEFFSTEAHQTIFTALNDLAEWGLMIDRVTVQANLLHNHTLEKAGGLEYLQSLNQPLTTSGQFESYTDIVRSAAMRRSMAKIGEEFVQKANKTDGNVLSDWEYLKKKVGKEEDAFAPYKQADFLSVVDEFLKSLDNSLHAGGNPDLISTGFGALDEIIGGFGKGELIVIGARPAMGKTAFAISLLDQMTVERKIPSAWVSMELPNQMLVTKLLSMRANILFSALQKAKIPEEELANLSTEAEIVKCAPLYLTNETVVSAERIAQIARNWKAKHDIQFLVIDYLQLMQANKRVSRDQRELQIADACRTLKRLARELQISVVLISQLSRAVETRAGDKKPILSDLRESGAIEQDADKVLLVYRGEYYGLEYDELGASLNRVAEIIVAKNRFGRLGSAKLYFNAPYYRFENYSAAEEPVEVIMDDDNPIPDQRLREKFKKIFQNNENKTMGLEPDTPF